ncbi:MAG: 2-hydroxyacyl-CoA dehydratase [Saprospiraceae bacterium]|nr:2-hydroxyacyl-CoA dehydratase [Saprospiraceae bacterium]
MNEAYHQLLFHYQNRKDTAQKMFEAGVPVTGYTSNTVPVELIEASGHYACLVDADVDDFTGSEQYMEAFFDRRTRSIFHEIITGKWSFLKLLIIPRTSEAEHKLYLYLKEVKRLTQNPDIPELYLFDLLHTQNSLSREYSFQQFVQLRHHLGNPDDQALYESLVRNNNIQHLLNNLAAYRHQLLLTGVEALVIIGALYFMEKSEYLIQLKKVLDKIGSRLPLPIKEKILVKGYGLNHTRFHESIEKHGSLVVAEDDWWGSRAGGIVMEESGDPAEKIFEKYYAHAPSPRLFPMEIAHSWVHEAMKNGIDQLVLYMPEEDDVLGWEAPLLLSYFMKN